MRYLILWCTLLTLAQNLRNRRSRRYLSALRPPQVQEPRCHKSLARSWMVGLHPLFSKFHLPDALARRPGSFFEFYKIVELLKDQYNIVMPYVPESNKGVRSRSHNEFLQLYSWLYIQ